MKPDVVTKRFFIIFIGFVLVCALLNTAAAEESVIIAMNKKSNVSLKNEIQHAIDKGLLWLKTKQNPHGYWSQPDYPALSALVLTAYMADPMDRFRANQPPFIEKAYNYLKKCVKPDGGIYVNNLACYNTSVCMMAFQVTYNPAYEQILINARNFLVGTQADLDIKGKTDSPYDGGIGYGGRYPHSDMSNTMFALESIYYTQYLAQKDDNKSNEIKELNWKAVIKFIERCQNLPEYNDQSWPSGDSENVGGFVYFPGESKAGEMELPDGKKALRSYGSISYAGLLSYIYAKLDSNDPRVKAVVDWLQKHYTLEENPGMDKQGLYYYYFTMAKALSSAKINEITLNNGKKINWREDLSLKLLNLQDGEGFWVNENGRWWEKDPVLVTSYAIIALEIIHRGL